ncbi:Inhibin beta chain [Amphibalanus amphitrite]|uniref:Inhibin beta chain n=1 Tax=Amphibalanus amphitrite TaxID=1232801 RepID=A0A6A4WYI5_AMPAM|nr:Inhibin beta chain [Amphibalanus amphitrite]
MPLFTPVPARWLSGGGVGSSSRRPQEVLRASFSLEAAEQPVGGAALRLWVRSGRRRRRPASLALYTVGGGRRHRLAVRPLPRAAGWVSFNVTDAARRASALRVELRCRRCGRRLSGAAPRLQLSRRRARRVRRDTADFLGQSEAVRSGSPVDCANSHDKKCCRQKMEVNFKELGGFEQIIAPASFQAYHCRGGCPASYNVANDHALLQGWIHEKHKQGVKNMPHAHAPCCAPSKLSALPIAHYDAQGKVRITYWENVVVEECRCS